MQPQRWDLERFGLAQMIELGRAIRSLEGQHQTLEGAAISIVKFLREHLSTNGEAACPLVRVYRTRRYQDLPADLQSFANDAAGTEPLASWTPCLELIATSGDLASWNDTTKSESHQAIPLVSPEAIERLPMVSRLITQFGIDVANVARAQPGLMLDESQSAFGVFHVAEAQGSEFVPAQDDFVKPYGIRSVLGFGGILPDDELFAVILFSRASISRESAKLFETIALHTKLVLLRALSNETDVAAARTSTLDQLLDVHERTGGVALETLELERSRLLDIFTKAPALISIVRGTNHVFEFANPAFRQTVSGREVVGLSVLEAFPELVGQGLVEMMDQVATTAEPLHTQEVPVQIDRDGSGRLVDGYFNLSLLPIIEDDNRVGGLITFAMEITELVEARSEIEALVESLRDLSRASLEINSRLSAGEMAHEIAVRALEMTECTYARVRVTDDESTGLMTTEAGDQSDASDSREFVIETKQGVIGSLTVSKNSDITASEASILDQLSRIASVALDNARLYEREHRIAEVLQRSLLPEQLPSPPGMRIVARYQPGTDGEQVGGDWYDAIQLGSGDLLLVLGDVSGRGVHAASVMGQLRTATRAYAIAGYGPREILENCDALLQDLYRDQMATVVVALIRPNSSLVQFASAGHLAPVVLPADGDPYLLELGNSVPLGVMPHATFAETELELQPGWTMLLYTDGLIERRTESLDVGFERLLEAVRTAPTGVEALSDHILERLTDGDRSDDIAMLACSTVPELPATLEITVPGEARRASGVRHTMAKWLSEQGASSSEIFDIVAVLGEAFANACEHGYRDISGAVNVSAAILDGTITLRVADRGSWRKPPTVSDRGRGLPLMRAFMDDVELRRSKTGTLIIATRRIQGEWNDRTG